MTMPEGAVFAPGEVERVGAAVKALAKDPHAPREVSVRVVLHVHNEYPKHVTTGQTEKGDTVTKIVHSAKEEMAAIAERHKAALAQEAAEDAPDQKPE